MIYTKFNTAIFDCIKDENCNLLVSALAGSGKTTTIIESLKFIPEDKRILLLAFNKHIAKELKERVPSNVHVYTTHSFGFSAIKRKYKDFEVDEFKTRKVIYKKVNSWNLPFGTSEDYIKNMVKMVSLCRLTLTFESKYIISLANKHDIKFEAIDAKRVLSVLETMHNDVKTFDFDDMVYQPIVRKELFLFKYDYVYVDEFQDYNKAQMGILKKALKKDGRFICFGDMYQAIYGFAGADNNAFDIMLKTPNTKILPLSICFRCAKNIVLEAQKIVPSIEFAENAIDGVVREGSALEESKEGDWILCRTTKPLVRMFFELLIKNKKACIKGKDIGLSIIDLIKPHENKEIVTMLYEINKNLHDYGSKLTQKGVNLSEDIGYMNFLDKIEVIDFISKTCKTVKELINIIQHIFNDNVEGIVLSTVHKSKGLEANRVFIIRPDKMPLKTSQAWAYQQEMNLKYISITRAKEELIWDNEWTDE